MQHEHSVRTVASVIQETHEHWNRMRWKEVVCDPGSDLLVCECSAEMLLDVGLQHCVEMLEFSISNQSYDVYLADTRETERATWLNGSIHLQGR